MSLLVPILFPPVGSMRLLDRGHHPYISTGLVENIVYLHLLQVTLVSFQGLNNIEYTRTVIYTCIALFAHLILYFRGIHPIKQGKTKTVEVMSYLVVVQCYARQVLRKHR